MDDEKGGRKKPVTLSVSEEIDELFGKISVKVIEINDKKIYIRRSKNDIYNRALEYAIENINEWAK